MRNLEKGQHIFIAFQGGKAVLDSQLRPRIYTSLENADKWTPTINKGKIEYVEYAPTITLPNEGVSVENALPEECADILLCRKILKIPEIGTYQQARFWVYDEIGDVYQVDDVTHWLPIPTPYDIEHIHISEPPEG